MGGKGEGTGNGVPPCPPPLYMYDEEALSFRSDPLHYYKSSHSFLSVKFLLNRSNCAKRIGKSLIQFL